MMSGNSSDNTSIDLGTVTSIVSSLQRVVADFYGPQCTQTLLTSQTGKAVVTSDGLCILDALQPSHPVAQIVFKALKSCHSVTLDGSKSFLLYLDYILLHLQEEISHGRFCFGGTNLKSDKGTLVRHGEVCARKYVRLLKQIVVPKLCEELQVHSDTLVENLLQKINETDVIKRVLKAALMPHYSPRLCEHFVDVLISSLPISSLKSSLLQVTQYIVDNFFKLSIKVSDQSYGGCTAVDLFLLNRKFTLKCDNLLSLSQVSVLIIKGSIDGCNTDDEPRETHIVQHAGQVVDILQHRRKMVEIFAHNLMVKKIDLIICTEGVPGYAVEVFRRHNISVITNVTNEDAELLEILTQKLSLNNICDCIENSHIIHVAGICELVVGGKMYVKLNVTNVNYPVKHLIVCAPTVGLCDQLAVAFQKALNALKMCFIQGNCQNSKEVTDCVTEVERDIGKVDLNGVDKDSIKVVSAVKDKDVVKAKLEEKDPSVKGNDTVQVEQPLEEKCFVKVVPTVQENDKVEVKQPSEEIDLLKVTPTILEKDLVKVGQYSITDLSKSFLYFNTLEQFQNIKFSVIQGGGSFEVLLAKLFHDFSKSCSDPNLSLICKVMEKSLISVVKKLFENTTMQPANKRGFMEVKTELDSKLSCGQLWGLSRRGVPCDLSGKGVMEPLLSKIHIMHCVLHLVDQLLGIDKIVSVRKLES